MERDEGARVALRVGNVPETDPGHCAQRFPDGGLVLALLGNDRVELSQLGKAQGPLKLVHAEIQAENGTALEGAAHLRVVVMAVVVIPLGAQVEIFVVRDDHPAFTRRHRLVEVEAEDPHVSDSAELFPAVAPARALRVVLEHLEIPFPGDRHDSVHVGRRPAHVDGDDGLRVRGQPPLDALGVQIQALVDVPGNRHCPGLQDGLVGGIERERRHDHFVAGPDIQGGQSNHKRGRSRRYAKRVGGPEIPGEFLLELPDLEYALPFLVKPVSHQDARLHDIHDFLQFLFSEKL